MFVITNNMKMAFIHFTLYINNKSVTDSQAVCMLIFLIFNKIRKTTQSGCRSQWTYT